MCFVDASSASPETVQLRSLMDPMEHTRIALTSQPSQCRLGHKHAVILTTVATNRDTFFNNLAVDMFDINLNKVPLTLKERVKDGQRIVKIEFEPNTLGAHKMIIRYRGANVPNTPLLFVVAQEDHSNVGGGMINFSENSFNPTAIKTEPTIAASGQMLPLLSSLSQSESMSTSTTSSTMVPASPVLSTTSLSSSNRADSGAAIANICAGRGRLLRQKLERGGQGLGRGGGLSNGFDIQPIVAQKRKDHASDLMSSSSLRNVESMECDVKEISNKLKKVVYVDEDQRRERAASASASTSLAINIDTRLSSSSSYSIASSDHLKKYSNNLLRILDTTVTPNLKVKFVKKFTGCYFPIGVRACPKRNWLIVCDSGNHTVKIFDKTGGQLLHEIKDIVGAPNLNFRRPSAVLIDPFKDNEIYIKDDKEIMVFDLDNNCQLVRRFGLKLFSRPYGLAFDSAYNLVLVDADLADPMIYTLDRQTGQVIRTKSYKPCIQNYADAAQLLADFGTTGSDIIGKQVQPFEKTKVRFIACSRDMLYSADLGRSLVYKTDLDGNIHLVFGHHGRKKGEFNEPSGVHVDPDANAIMVGDSRNNRIQIYDGQGRYKCDVEFLEDNIIRPSDIYIDMDGYLYVSCFIQHVIKKFKIVTE